jgi:hypothetical protein
MLSRPAKHLHVRLENFEFSPVRGDNVGSPGCQPGVIGLGYARANYTFSGHDEYSSHEMPRTGKAS